MPIQWGGIINDSKQLGSLTEMSEGQVKKYKTQETITEYFPKMTGCGGVVWCESSKCVFSSLADKEPITVYVN